MDVNIPRDIILFQEKSGKQPFKKWMASLDPITREQIRRRLIRLSLGNWGDYKALSSGVFELRIHFGAGYRVYYAQDDKVIIILLCGGTKHNQQEDIKRAIQYWKEYKELKYD